MKKLFLLSLSLLALHLGARAQDTSIVFGTPFHISGGVSRGGTGIVYQWQCNGNDIDDATNPDYTTLTTLKPGMYTYVRKSVCVECGGRWQYTNPHTIEVICPDPVQPSLISGTGAANKTQCAGLSYVYTVSTISGYTFNWAVPAGWKQTAGTNTNSITVTTGDAPGKISVTPVQDGSGCLGKARDSSIVTVNKQPTLTLITNNADQKVFASRAITTIKYARTGSVTTNTFGWSPSTPAGITATNGTDSIKGTPTATGTYNYTLTVTATGCSNATATGTIVVSAACVEGTNYQYRNGKCYSAKGSVAYNAGSDANCASVSWFGAGYKLAPYTDAQYVACPLYGVAVICTGTDKTFTGAASNYYDNLAANICHTTSGNPSTQRPTGVGLGRPTNVLPISNVSSTSTTFATVGHLCVREP